MPLSYVNLVPGTNAIPKDAYTKFNLNDINLPDHNIQTEDPSVKLKFEDMTDSDLDDEDSPEVAGADNHVNDDNHDADDNHNNDDNDDDGHNDGGGNNDNIGDTTDISEPSASQPSNDLGGVNEGSSSRTPLHNEDILESPRNKLSRQIRWNRDHHFDSILGDPDAGVKTRRATQNECKYSGFLSVMEPKSTEEALDDPDWVIAMQDELNQFKQQEVWKLVPRPKHKKVHLPLCFPEDKKCFDRQSISSHLPM